MLALWLIWSVSLLSMGLITFAAMRRIPTGGYVAAVGMSVGDIVRSEADAARDAFLRWLAIVRPSVLRAAAGAIRFIRSVLSRASTRLDQRIYGKGAVESGSSASFFVKRIREFKDELSRDDLRS